MGDARYLIRLLHGNSKSLNLNGKRLKEVPTPLHRMQSLVVLEIKNNQLVDCPEFLANLINLETINLGNNKLKIFPDVLQQLKQLKKLHLFGNFITDIKPSILENISGLILLNLNNNNLKTLPSGIGSLQKLQTLSLNGNKLEKLPEELCSLVNLKELQASHNLLSSLPLEIGGLSSLVKLCLAQNKIKELPEGLGKLRKLHILDVAGNELRIFPTETQNIPLTELYFEANPLLEQLPVHSIQEEEVLSLKELSARLVMREVKIKGSVLRNMIPYFPGVRDMLSQASRCAVCSEAFLNTWLECVKFIKVNKDLKVDKCNNTSIPIRALLCSYKCFNSEGHTYYGVAFP